MSAYNRHIRQHWSFLRFFHRLTDAASIGCGLALAARYSNPASDDSWPLVVGAVAVALFFVFGEIGGVYRSWRGTTADREIVSVLSAWSFTLLTIIVLDVVFRAPVDYSRWSLVVWLLTTPSLIVGIRIIVRWILTFLRARGLNTRGFAIVGVNELGIDLAKNIENSPELGLKLTGFYDDRPSERTVELPENVGSKIGNISELVDHAREGKVDMIYITFPMRAEDRIKGVLSALGDTTASVHVVPDFFVFELLHSRWTNINGLPVVSVFENPFYGVDGIVKRATDIVFATLALLLVSIPMMVIAVLIKRSSPGPVFFRQRRYGLDGCEIMVWKFRSMRVCEDGDKVVQATKNDSRITRIGAFIRKTSLDELPQLFNVIDGSMSLVGPRPHATAHNEEYRKLIQGYMLRHKVKPGITGLAQVNGWRGETDTLEKMERRVECDHRYIREWSIWLDIKILMKTVLVVLSRQNAY